MSERDDKAPDLSALLRGARGDVPSVDQQNAVMGALAARIASNGGGGGEGGPGDVPPPRPRRLGRLLGGSTLVVGGAIAVWLLARTATPSSHPRIQDTAPVAVVASPPLPVTPPPTLDAPTAMPAPLPAAPHVDRSESTPSEAALIERARALMAKSPARALALTELHRRAFRTGELAPEREVLAIDALVRLHRRAEAVARADAFRAAHPHSIHASRISAILGDEISTPQ